MDEEYAEIINDQGIKYTWSQEDEDEFTKIRAGSKKSMISIINTSSWSQIAFSNNI